MVEVHILYFADKAIGFTAPNNDGILYLARFKVGCCAADAFPIRVELVGNIPTDVPPDTWVRVYGQHDPTSSRFPGETFTNVEPKFEVESYEVIQKPDNVYL